MLKAYKVRTYISVNNKPKIESFRVSYGLTEDELPRVVTTSWSFQEALNQKLPTPTVKTGATLFRKRPYITVEETWCDTRRYYNFDSITIERHYEPWDDITLKDLFDDFSVDECIQYLKERGINTCPILK